MPILSIAAILALLWLTCPPVRSRKAATVQHQQSDTATPQIGGNAETPSATPLTTYDAALERLRSDFRTPISFYGKVIDQHGVPVSDANVRLFVGSNSETERRTEYFKKSDAAGLFSITGVAGLTLATEVSKPGYRVIPPAYGRVTSGGVFEYGLSSGGVHQSSAQSPTVFVLHRIGVLEPLIKVGEKNFRIARDGVPLAIATDGQGGHQIVLRCWNEELQRPAGQRQYSWRLEIAVPSGGLVARDDAFIFEAPEIGYVPSDTIEMPASLSADRWRGSAQRSYFIRFNDDIFARVKLEMRAGGDHFVAWESYLNPKPGSRNLESAN